MLFLLISVALGAGGWLIARELSTRRTFSLDEASLQFGTASGNGDGPTRLSLDATTLASLQDPFFAQPCYFSAVQTCLLELVKVEADVFMFRSEPPRKAILSPGRVSFAVGRMLGTPDNLRAHFANQRKEQEYFEFVRQLRDRSLENHLNPALVYAFYDFVLSQQQDVALEIDLPDASLVANLIATGFIMFESDVHSSAASASPELAEWSPHGKALLYAATWSFPNIDLVKATFSEVGAFDHFYTQRFFGSWVNKPFSIALDSTALSSSEYFRFSARSDELVACYQESGVICTLEAMPDREFWDLKCRPAEFLTPLCGDLLINL